MVILSYLEAKFQDTTSLRYAFLNGVKYEEEIFYTVSKCMS